MKIIAEYGREELAKVYVAEMRKGRVIECVESLQPPLLRHQKWVLIVSSLFGCPVGCAMCDAGGKYLGRLTADEILQQVQYMVDRRFPNGVETQKFKIQFARMGEPSLNPAVLDAMVRLFHRYGSCHLHIALSTIAPALSSTSVFLKELALIKERCFSNGTFQLQFSIHTTDLLQRKKLIPMPTWGFEQIADYGRFFVRPERGDRKISLNFATIEGYRIDPALIRSYFDPAYFLIKLTPLNPTINAHQAGLRSVIDPATPQSAALLVDAFRDQGFDVILNIGEPAENQIGSNCGQFVSASKPV
jgi:23S rRNA (adenine2503-C2)-methyltransferase